MLFKYKYVNHEIEKFQKYSDFLFFNVWLKARGVFNSDKLNRYNEFKLIFQSLELSTADWAYFFTSRVEMIYNEFLKLGQSQRKELKRCYLANNKIQYLCCSNFISPISYDELKLKYPHLSRLLNEFYSRLYGSTSPFILIDFGNLKEIKKSHYTAFVNENFEGHEGVCPFVV